VSVHAAIVHAPIDPSAVLRGVGDDEDGAVVLFLGTVRDHNEGRPVRGLRYEAYEAMAQAVLEAIAREAGERAGTDRVVVLHRVGELAVGEYSVAIAVAAPHRSDAYDASRYIIEEIKKRLPVWKHEHYADGAARWLDGAAPPVGERS
jgi:molybdopterin synthase catalytic subunit